MYFVNYFDASSDVDVRGRNYPADGFRDEDAPCFFFLRPRSRLRKQKIKSQHKHRHVTTFSRHLGDPTSTPQAVAAMLLSLSSPRIAARGALLPSLTRHRFRLPIISRSPWDRSFNLGGGGHGAAALQLHQLGNQMGGDCADCLTCNSTCSAERVPDIERPVSPLCGRPARELLKDLTTSRKMAGKSRGAPGRA